MTPDLQELYEACRVAGCSLTEAFWAVYAELLADTFRAEATVCGVIVGEPD